MRDVIQVERAGAGGLAELARVADELLPPLVARLGVSELGEIEVRHGDWRVRVRRAPVMGASPAPAPTASAPTGGAGQAAGRDPAAGAAAGATSVVGDHPVATAPAVGYFGISGGLAVGHHVTRGDVIGWVDVLGVRREIVAPADGTLERLLVDPGDPVEYGQALMAIIPPPSGVGSAEDAPGAMPRTEDGRA